ncbi:MAG: hypothetical protein K9N48_03285 [Verrucomicrobia bacterium]|nr:hypothetical protein [Verrucomicrobiota bacterium]MCF7708178.1 hypothetical protein [Verrucomicrobiota bacterium]
MSSGKLDKSGVFSPVTIENSDIAMSLSPETVKVRKNGIEFKSFKHIPIWKEMTVALQPPGQRDGVEFNGVIVACNGNKHTGYYVSMLFTSLSPGAQEQLMSMAVA